MLPIVNNLMASSPDVTETFQTLLNLPGIRLEQIVSNGQASEEGFWYDQEQSEWGMLARGCAVLRFEPGGELALNGCSFFEKVLN